MNGPRQTVRRRLHRLRFTLWMLGAGDVDGFEQRVNVRARMRRLHRAWASRADDRREVTR